MRSNVLGNKEPEEERSGVRPCALLAQLRILVFSQSMGKPSERCEQCSDMIHAVLVTVCSLVQVEKVLGCWRDGCRRLLQWSRLQGWQLQRRRQVKGLERSQQVKSTGLDDVLATASKGREAKDHPLVCLTLWVRTRGLKRRQQES